MDNLRDAIEQVLKGMRVTVDVSQLRVEVVGTVPNDQAKHDQAEHDQAEKTKEEDQQSPEGKKDTQAGQQGKPTTGGTPGQTGAGKAGS